MKLSIWVTRSCNMDCDYCYEQDNLRDDIFINEYEYIEKCIDFINTTCHKTNSNKLFIKFLVENLYLNIHLYINLLKN